MASREGEEVLKAESQVEVLILASYSCSEVKDLLEKQHTDNFLEDFLIAAAVAEQALSLPQEPNGLVELQLGDSQEPGCTASWDALAG